MDHEHPAPDAPAPAAPPSLTGDVPDCCVRTIRQHAKFNPMMVCGECKQIIKCFTDQRAFENYLTFCKSRRRQILRGTVETLYTVVFRSYETSYR